MNILKNTLYLSIIVSILIISFSVMSFTKSVEQQAIRKFSVSGEGEVTAIPDIAKFSFSIINQGGNEIIKLQEDVTNKNNSIINFLKSEDIIKEDIKTTDFNIQPRYQYHRCKESGICPPSEIIGYTVSQSTQVKIRDFSKIGEILAGVANKGANSVSGLQFTLDNPEEPRNEARAKAIQQAKRKAESVAKAGGFKLGKLLSISESTLDYRYGFQAMEASIAIEAPSIEPGSEEIKINITLEYEIK